MEASRFLLLLWDKSRVMSALTYFERFFFLLLCFLEYPYKFIFYCYQRGSLFFCGSITPPWKTISVGNISVGGTGKSTIVSLLVQELLPRRGAIVLRGYKGTNESSGESLLVCDGQNILTDVRVAGDEAFMFASLYGLPVIVGSSRAKSLQLLLEWQGRSGACVDYVILDDAYQQVRIKKNLEVLLLDARKPFENDHCLPAGKLREQDISRADCIVLTSARDVSAPEVAALKVQLRARGFKGAVFSGYHDVVAVRNQALQVVACDVLQGLRLVPFAGVGFFGGFLATVSHLGVSMAAPLEFPDHYRYEERDVERLIEHCRHHGAQGVITTRKDWYKIAPLFMRSNQACGVMLYMVDVAFVFTSTEERIDFFNLATKKIEVG